MKSTNLIEEDKEDIRRKLDAIKKEKDIEDEMYKAYQKQVKVREHAENMLTLVLMRLKVTEAYQLRYNYTETLEKILNSDDQD